MIKGLKSGRKQSNLEGIIISDEVGIKKPDPKIFHLALSKINSNSETTLFVGDNPLWDVKGAIDAGLVSVWLSNGQTWNIKHYRPRYIIKNISELMTSYVG